MPGPRRPVLLAAATVLAALAVPVVGDAWPGTHAPGGVAAPPTTVPTGTVTAAPGPTVTGVTTVATVPGATATTATTVTTGAGRVRRRVLTGRVEMWTPERVAIAVAAGIGGLALTGFVYGRVRSHTRRVRRAGTDLAPRAD